MPRRTGSAAYKVVLKELWTRTRFLLRNPAFRDDLQTFYNGPVEQTSPRNIEAENEHWFNSGIDLQKKWKLEWVPLKWPFDSSLSLSEQIKKDEKFLWKEIRERGQSFFLSPFPVVARDPDQEALDRLEEEISDYESDEGEPPSGLINKRDQCQPGKSLILNVDLSYPKDILEDLIKLELTKAFRCRTRQRAMESTPQVQRRRLDKIDFQIKVHDQIKAGRTFRQLATSLRKPLSTIKSSYLTAVAKIGDPFAIQPEVHSDSCSQCQRASRIEEMCPVFRRYADQDYRSQREILSTDLVEHSQDYHLEI